MARREGIDDRPSMRIKHEQKIAKSLAGDDSVLAEQLVTFAGDFVAEYQRFNVLGVIQEVTVLLQKKRQIDDGQYNREALPIRNKCLNVVASSLFNSYP